MGRFGVPLLCWLVGLGCGVVQGPASAHLVPAADEPLLIRFLDVGQGDATLVTLGSESVLIDGGRGRGIILLLAEYQVDSLVAVVASHNHDDHVGGLVAVVADIPIGVFLGNGRPPTTENGEELEEWLAKRAVSRPSPPWPAIRLGDAVLTARRSPLGSSASENNSSLVVMIERGDFRALLTGDSEAEQLNALLGEASVPTVDVLKAAHHGARNGVTPGWLDRTRPSVVVVSAGAGNGYGHPDPWALRYYQASGRRVLRTDLDGSVTIAVDRAGGFRVTTSGATPR